MRRGRGELVADVPLGFMLSGGLDSSVLSTLGDRYLRADYEHFEPTGSFRESDGRRLPVFQWSYRTVVAE
ncbi:hypothetical protein GCM10012275_62230 [Longimycelium tulufanense]|uniref:Asparagine synthetase domain-containing protein n=1 Tax=Longimycelium tulufanense TaxID=907463 RepID=A0A8J3FZS1_9PSEU|nr:DUF5988 family protein [Longimycelium tulufanense]GGM83174.1 hypothetical protein GCM10012275_62230 [Longimycelium tulufanense]